MTTQIPSSQNTSNPSSIFNPDKNNGKLIEMPAVDPATARGIIDGRTMPKIDTLPASASVLSLVGGGASNTALGPASIAELARALKNDPQLMFEFVYNNIEFTPSFGLQKSALGCLTEGFGNSFDQSALLIALLRQAGFTASYSLGTLQLTLAQCQSWLDIDANIFTANSIFSNGGVPVAVVGTFPNQKLEISHCWVQAVVAGNTVVMDPSFKTYTVVSGVNVATATGYNAATFLTQATSGATIDASGNWVQNINTANVNSQMQALSTSLLNYIKTNNPAATLDQVVGGRQIAQIFAPFTYLTALPYQKPGDVPVIWTTDIPTNYKITVSIDGSGIGLNASGTPITYTGDQLYGKRLTLFYNSSNQPVLSLDGTVVATGTAQFYGSWNSILVTVTHNAYTSTNNNQSFWQRVNAISAAVNGNAWYYLLGMSFGRTTQGMIDYHQQISIANDFTGGSDTSEPILGERLAILWANYCAELGLGADLLGKITKTVYVNHHLVGMTGYSVNSTFGANFFDLQGSRGGVSTLDSSSSSSYIQASGMTWGIMGYTLEDLVIRQYGGDSAASATKILHVANGAGTKIYKGSQANWAGTVVPALSGYNASDLSDIATYYLPYGWFAFLPQTASQALTTGTGTGWSLVSQYGGAAGIINYFKGGTGDKNTSQKKTKQKDEKKSKKKQDPISALTGDFLYRNDDISLGSGEFPYKLTFQSAYDSRLRFEAGTMGLGWRHNWDLTATSSGNGFVGLGQRSPLPAAASITMMYVLVDLLSDNSLPVQKVVSAHEAAYWWIGQMSNNTVTVPFLDEAVTFAQLADGSFYPLEAYAGSLALVSGAYKITTAQKDVINFNTSGQMSSMVFANGVTVTLTYTGGKLTSISNGMGRTLTLNYTGSFITSVTDGTGRTVSYSRDASNNLTTFVDPNTKSTTFQYVSAGMMSKLFYPANPLVAVVTNTFDSLNRVKTQANALAQVSNFYFAGSRTEVTDPLGNKDITYWSSLGDPLKEVDALGFATTYQFDGRRRMTQMVMPEGNQTLWTFDSNNNPLTITSVAKSGSGLSNIVQTFTYDPTWAKVKTAQDGRLNTTTYSYDPATGNLLTIQRPIVGGSTPTVTMTYNSRGQMLSSTDETAIVTQYTYDVTTEKRLTQVVDFGSGRLNLQTSYGYDTVGNVNSVTDPRSNITLFQFDAKRRPTQRTEPTPFSYVTKFTFDDNDNLIKQERQTGGAPAQQTYSWTYSLTDQVKTFVDPATQTTTWTFDGNDRVQTMTDAQSRQWQYGYDARNKISTVTDSSATVCDTRTYTANGKLASIKDARNNTTQYTWDGFDRASKTIFADTTFEQKSSYDANGNVLTSLTRSGSSIVNTFDVLNRLSTKSPTGQPVVTATYDLAGRLTQLSKPVVAGDPSSGATQFFFDTAGRFFKEQYPDGKIVVHVLDGNGNPTKTTWPDTYFVDRTFDQLNRLSNIKLNGSATNAVVFSYNQLSQRTQLTYSNGATVVYTPQLNEDVTGIAHNFVGSSVSFAYGFNNVHEPLTQTVSDSLYMWHPAGAATVTYATADNVNKYPTVGGTSYTYSTNKCLTGDGVWTYGYDTENHLLTASKTGTSASFVYDPMHRQSQKTVGTVKSRYIYAGWQRIADYDGTAGTLQTRYVYGPGLDEPLIQVTSAGVLTFLHHDKMGSIVATSSNTGAVTNKNKFSPFGEITTLAGTNFGFTGQRYDSELGLLYFKRRYLSPKLGRFLQPDPIGYTGFEDFNLYTYVGNSPLVYTDPMGLVKKKIVRKIKDGVKKIKETKEKIKKWIDEHEGEPGEDGLAPGYPGSVIDGNSQQPGIGGDAGY